MGNLSGRVTKLERGGNGPEDVEAAQILRDVETDPEYTTLSEAHKDNIDTALALTREGRGKEITMDAERSVATLWDGFWTVAMRLADERGVAGSRVHTEHHRQRNQEGGE